MTAEQNAEVRTFQVGQFMCATAGATNETALALIKAPGGTAQRMHARLKAVEMLVRNGSAPRHAVVRDAEADRLHAA